MWQTNLWDESLIGEPDVLDLLPKGALTLITHFLIISLHFVSSSRPLHLYFYLHCLLLEPQPHWHYPIFFFFKFTTLRLPFEMLLSVPFMTPSTIFKSLFAPAIDSPPTYQTPFRNELSISYILHVTD